MAVWRPARPGNVHSRRASDARTTGGCPCVQVACSCAHTRVPAAVPASELAALTTTFSGLLSFSRSFKQSPVAPKCVWACNTNRAACGRRDSERPVPLACRLANWGKATAVRFAPSGERFAAVSEGGVVATWCLRPGRVDDDGHGTAEWWHQARLLVASVWCSAPFSRWSMRTRCCVLAAGSQ